MAEAIGVASGLLALGQFAFQSSVALYQTISSYQSHQQRVRELAEEASALSGVLGSLVETVKATTDLDLSSLEMPLRQCGKACQVFEQQIQKCSSRSTGARASVRDWARLRYMGEDMDGFRRLLAGYKMTITVALTDANLRRSAITSENIEGYNELLNTAKEELEDRLERIDERLDTLIGKSVAGSTPDTSELIQIKEEKLSTEKSLAICAQLSMHISQAQLATNPAPSAGGKIDKSSIPDRITQEGLEECKHSLSRMAAKLRDHEKLLFNRLTEKMKASTASPEEAADIARLRDEWESTFKSIDILSAAGSYFEKETSVIENHATGDAMQVMVATDEKTLHGTNRGLGWRSRQIGGRMDNETVRQISRDMVTFTIRNIHDEELPRRPTPTTPGDKDTSGRYSEFHESYLNEIPRSLSTTSDDFISEDNAQNLPGLIEGIENDGRRAEEVEEAGLSQMVALPADNEQSLVNSYLTESNSAWKAEKSYDKKIGTTNLQSIYSVKYSISEMGRGKVTLFCPQGPIKDDDDLELIQTRWLHVKRSAMSIKVLEVGYTHKLIMDCPLLNGDLRRVAILLLEAVERNFLRESENGAYMEPGSILRYVGTRHMLHDSRNFVVTDPVIFAAFPYVELSPSKQTRSSNDRDEFYPRTLLQNLYGFDVVTSRDKHQVIHKMSASSQTNNTLYANQLWYLLIGPDILITMSDQSADDLLGDSIEKRSDYFRQPLRIEIVEGNGHQHSMSISSKTPWVDFFRHVMLTVHGNLINIMHYELVDQANEVLTAERWVEIVKSTKPPLFKFYLVERRTAGSRSSSLSSRRSSRSGINRLLMMDYAFRNTRQASKSSLLRRQKDGYEGDSSSSERTTGSKKPSAMRGSGLQGDKRPSIDVQWHRPPVVFNSLQPRQQTESNLEANALHKGFQNSYEVISLNNNETSSTNDEASTAVCAPKDSDEHEAGVKGPHEEEEASLSNLAELSQHQRASPDEADEADRTDKNTPPTDHPLSYDHSLKHREKSPEKYSGGITLVQERKEVTACEGNLSSSANKQKEGTLTQAVQRALPPEEAKGYAEESSSDRIANGRPSRSPETKNKPKTTTTTYRKVEIEDQPEQSDHEYLNNGADTYTTRVHSRITKVNFDDTSTPEQDWPEDRHGTYSPVYSIKEVAPDERYILHDSSNFQKDVSSERSRYRSRSWSLSNSTDDSFHIRGRSRTRRPVTGQSKQSWTKDSDSFNVHPFSHPEVRFDSHGHHTGDKQNVESSPYGSSNATKVEILPVQVIIPFFCWKQSNGMGTFASQDTTEQILIKLLDQIDELISDDPINKYYSKVPELTMDDVLTRQPAFDDYVPEGDSSTIRDATAKLYSVEQVLWEESQKGFGSKHTYTIRNFSSQFKKTGLFRKKPTLGKIHYLDCEDCKTEKAYSECERPYDDPCYVWLRRIQHNEYPIRRPRDILQGNMEDFIDELSDISNYVTELHNMTARDLSTNEAVSTPLLSVNVTHTFQQIVKLFVFRSKQLSLINRRQSLADGSLPENIREIQRISQKIEELLSQEVDTHERIIDLLESAKKDIFLSGIGSHTEMLQAETVRAQFLALAFMSGIQKPLLQPPYLARSFVKDTLLQLYKDYTSRLHFQANRRPRKRVFLDIHGLEEELQALDKLSSGLENFEQSYNMAMNIYVN
ncbi:hypothetical protein TARUN_142 [Trichoderma arundinaceum]|uniref:Azaphilone pigments biosynthesis cluster protein L N-terminal domain-containing protein n=1 Tax=Trichoderma arundinaceum TaxID=490622 RepID=A0A395P189_TRIAR|nr:hypothetical protein TARUN_142 [Trichoderma arundinaceum]